MRIHKFRYEVWSGLQPIWGLRIVHASPGVEQVSCGHLWRHFVEGCVFHVDVFDVLLFCTGRLRNAIGALLVVYFYDGE